MCDTHTQREFLDLSLTVWCGVVKNPPKSPVAEPGGHQAVVVVVEGGGPITRVGLQFVIALVGGSRCEQLRVMIMIVCLARLFLCHCHERRWLISRMGPQ